jgi:hypothetical protein
MGTEAATRAAAQRRWSVRRGLYQLCLVLALGSLAFGGVELVSWKIDRARLRAVAVAATASAKDEVERLTLLTNWVYLNKGFSRNRRHHLWWKLHETPIQVLDHGGGCEEKSKLLVALLRELDVGGSLAMLYPCEGCRTTHTVAFVETRAGWTLADTAYNITFPDRRGGFSTIEALRAEPALLERRLAELRAERGPADKINRYQRETHHYSHMTTVNWGKNALTRGVAGLLRAAGAEPWSTPRPLFLDDPKQFFALAGGGGALAFGLLALLLYPRRGGPRRPLQALPAVR